MNLPNNKSFCFSTSGSVIIIFALALLPIIGAIGVGIDYARRASQIANLQQVLDSSVWAAAYIPSAPNSARIEFGKQHFWGVVSQEYADQIKSLDIQIGKDGKSITGSVYGIAPTKVLNIVGIKDYHYEINAEANFKQHNNPKNPNNTSEPPPSGCWDLPINGSGAPIWRGGRRAGGASSGAGGGAYFRCE